ncbi:MAG: hypothetical protein EPN74_01245 [Rhodanobacter sp.]|nr:MAG: hypothetical protein EPN74_01245 [Rhodanobacter sp.]
MRITLPAVQRLSRIIIGSHYQRSAFLDLPKDKKVCQVSHDFSGQRIFRASVAGNAMVRLSRHMQA